MRTTITTETPTRNQTVLAAVTGATAQCRPRGQTAGAVRALSPSASGIATIVACKPIRTSSISIWTREMLSSLQD